MRKRCEAKSNMLDVAIVLKRISKVRDGSGLMFSCVLDEFVVDELKKRGFAVEVQRPDSGGWGTKVAW